MRYNIKNVKKFDEWKKEVPSRIKDFATDEEMIFPAMLMFGVGGSIVTTALSASSTPALFIGGALGLYGLAHTSSILLGNVKFSEVKEKIQNEINKVVEMHKEKEEHVHKR